MEGEEWDELQRNLMATIPVYDRINRFATLGQVSRWRKMVREKLPQGRVLEIGCGPSDQRKTEARSDVAVFTSEALAHIFHGRHLCGRLPT